MSKTFKSGWANMHDWLVFNHETNNWVQVTAMSAFEAWRNTPNSGQSYTDLRIQHVKAHDL